MQKEIAGGLIFLLSPQLQRAWVIGVAASL